jgi:L-threonylcarbamoyladenylate synthase
VQADLGDDVDLILDGGDCAVGVESTIVAFQGEHPVILRPGMITAAQIAAVLGDIQAEATASTCSTVSRAPGTLASHYAPLTPVELVPGDRLQAVIDGLKNQPLGVLALQECPAEWADVPSIKWQAMPNQPDAYAQKLYAQLRKLDALQCHRILVEMPIETGAWGAVVDRLRRAAY